LPANRPPWQLAVPTLRRAKEKGKRKRAKEDTHPPSAIPGKVITTVGQVNALAAQTAQAREKPGAAARDRRQRALWADECPSRSAASNEAYARNHELRWLTRQFVSAEGHSTGRYALEPALASCAGKGRHAGRAADGSAKPPAELFDRIDPSFGVDRQTFEDRQKSGGNCPSLVGDRYADAARPCADAALVGADAGGR
jgi:hypothetical protein